MSTSYLCKWQLPAEGATLAGAIEYLIAKEDGRGKSSCVLVDAGGKAQAMFTEGDVVFRALAAARDGTDVNAPLALRSGTIHTATLAASADVREECERLALDMGLKKSKNLPVADEAGRFVGILTASKAITAMMKRGSWEKAARSLKLQEFTRHVRFVPMTETIAAAVDVMRGMTGTKAVFVTPHADSKLVLGIVTLADVLHKAIAGDATRKAWHLARVDTIMTPHDKLVSLQYEDSDQLLVTTVIDRMVARGFRHFPLVDVPAEQRPASVFSSFLSLFKAVAEDDEPIEYSGGGEVLPSQLSTARCMIGLDDVLVALARGSVIQQAAAAHSAAAAAAAAAAAGAGAASTAAGGAAVGGAGTSSSDAASATGDDDADDAGSCRTSRAGSIASVDSLPGSAVTHTVEFPGRPGQRAHTLLRQLETGVRQVERAAEIQKVDEAEQLEGTKVENACNRVLRAIDDLVEISPVKLPAPGTTAPAFTRDEAAIALAIRCAIVKACQSAADAIVSLSTREELCKTLLVAALAHASALRKLYELLHTRPEVVAPATFTSGRLPAAGSMCSPGSVLSLRSADGEAHSITLVAPVAVAEEALQVCGHLALYTASSNVMDCATFDASAVAVTRECALNIARTHDVLADFDLALCTGAIASPADDNREHHATAMAATVRLMKLHQSCGLQFSRFVAAQAALLRPSSAAAAAGGTVASPAWTGRTTLQDVLTAACANVAARIGAQMDADSMKLDRACFDDVKESLAVAKQYTALSGRLQRLWIAAEARSDVVAAHSAATATGAADKSTASAGAAGTTAAVDSAVSHVRLLTPAEMSDVASLQRITGLLALSSLADRLARESPHLARVVAKAPFVAAEEELRGDKLGPFNAKLGELLASLDAEEFWSRDEVNASAAARAQAVATLLHGNCDDQRAEHLAHLVAIATSLEATLMPPLMWCARQKGALAAGKHDDYESLRFTRAFFMQPLGCILAQLDAEQPTDVPPCKSVAARSARAVMRRLVLAIDNRLEDGVEELTDALKARLKAAKAAASAAAGAS